MKRLLLIFYLLTLCYTSIAQEEAALNLTELSYIPKQKFDSYISKKGFAFIGTSYKTDTIARDFDYKGIGKKGADSIPVQRSVTSFSTKEDFSLVYRTTSQKEFQKIKTDIKK